MSSSPVTLDFSKAQSVAPQSSQPVSLDFSKAQPIQGGGVSNQEALDTMPDLGVPGVLPNVVGGVIGKLGTEALGGVEEGAAKTVVGLGNLAAAAAEKILGKPAGSLQATGEFPAQPTMAGKAGELAENVGEYATGDEALKGIAKIATLPEPILALLEKYPKASKIAAGMMQGATIGGAQGAVKGAAEGQAEAGAKAGAEGGAIGGGVAEAIPAAAEAVQESKLGRAAVNRSMGVLPREVKYASPASAIDREGIWQMNAGDWNKLLEARRAGATPEAAAQAAGGRFAAVYNKINEYMPQLDQMLQQSPAKIPVSEVIDKPLQDELGRIIDQTAMTKPQQTRFLNGMAQLEKAWKDNLQSKYGDLDEGLTPAQVNEFKQDVGDAMSIWGKDLRNTPDDNVQRAYLTVYEAAKSAVNKAVPEAQELNNRVSDLLAARNSLEHLIQAQESGETSGPSGSTHSIWAPWGLIETEAGKIIPALAQGTEATAPAMRTVLPPLTAGYTRAVLSNGAIVSVPNENVQRLQARDPGMQVLESSQQQPQQ